MKNGFTNAQDAGCQLNAPIPEKTPGRREEKWLRPLNLLTGKGPGDKTRPIEEIPYISFLAFPYAFSLYLYFFSYIFFPPFLFACVRSIVEWELLRSLAANAALYLSTKEVPSLILLFFPLFLRNLIFSFSLFFVSLLYLLKIVPPLGRKKAASPNGVLFQILSLTCGRST